MRTKTKKRANKPSKSKQLQSCKHCQQKLYPSDIRKSQKKYLEEIPGFWGGIEKPYEQYFDVNCSNPNCKKKYQVKFKKSDWLYK